LLGLGWYVVAHERNKTAQEYVQGLAGPRGTVIFLSLEQVRESLSSIRIGHGRGFSDSFNRFPIRFLIRSLQDCCGHFRSKRRIKLGQMGRWDVPTAICLVGFVRGRKTSSDKVDSARELRHEGCSVREIARRLRISKSAAHRFVQGISTELPDEVAEQEGTQATEALEAPEMTLQSVPEEEGEDPELITLRERLDDFRFETAVAVMDGDTIAAEQTQRKLPQHMRMANRYFQRRLRATGYRPYLEEGYSQPEIRSSRGLKISSTQSLRP